MASHLFDTMASFGCSYLVVAASPGPNFIIISRAGLVGSRAAAALTAIGVVLGASALTVIAVSCAQWFLQDGRVIAFTECIFVVLLLRWSLQAFGRALSDPAEGTSTLRPDHRYLRQGFLTAASNPFTAAFLATAPDPDLTPLDAVETVFIVASLWFGFISLICRHPRMHALYDRRRRHVETIFGFVFLGIFIKTLAKIASLLR